MRRITKLHSNASVRDIYEASDGAATTALYRELEALGPAGAVAANLFRAQKTSSRAKKYGRTKWLLIAVGLILFFAIGFIRFLANPESYK